MSRCATDTCPVTVHVPTASRDRHVAVFYLHGGGLLYGERDDLPAPYVRALTDAGYTLVCADYPLCPEATMAQAVQSAFATWKEYVAEAVERGELTGYFLFGRSAGGHLALMLAREIRRRGGANGGDALPQPLGVLDFYGYPTLEDPAFREPAAAYTGLPEVTRAQVDRIAPAGAPAPTSGPKALRYALYVYARQHEGAWLELMGLDAGAEPGAGTETGGDAGAGDPASPATWSLSAEDVAALPPLFITASSGDEDVPLRLSKALARTAPQAAFKWVYYLPHDFDRDTADPTGMEVYRRAIAWMDGLTG